MFTAMEVKNLRVFADKTHGFDLCPLTIFCGTNNAGKSTLLKLIPLLRQTQAIEESYGVDTGRLRYTGSQVDMGDFKSLITNGDKARDLHISLTITDVIPHWMCEELTQIKQGNAITGPKSKINKNVNYSLNSSLVIGMANHDFRAKHARTKDTNENGSSAIEKLSAIDQLKSASFTLSSETGDPLLDWQVKLTDRNPEQSDQDDDFGPMYSLLIPETYFRHIKADRTMAPVALEGTYVRVGASLRGLLPFAALTKWKPPEATSEVPDRRAWTLFPLMPTMPTVALATDDLLAALKNTHYLAPLRSPAKRFYLATSDARPKLDPNGDFLPYILKTMESAQSRTRNARLSKASAPGEEGLLDALNYWLFYLKTGHEPSGGQRPTEIQSQTTKDVIVELHLKSIGSPGAFALADSGFGYSQVLPILLAGLLTRPGGALVIEQPELHLNPALQVRLTDFFISMVKCGKQVLLETHSEHIVNAVRVRSAEDEDGDLFSKCSIYFLGCEADGIVVKKMMINPNGTVPDWPPDFFGEAISLTARLLRAQQRFRNKPKG